MTTAEYVARRVKLRQELSNQEAKLEQAFRNIRMGKALVLGAWIVTIVSSVPASLGHWDNGWVIPVFFGGLTAIISSISVWIELTQDSAYHRSLIGVESRARAQVDFFKEELVEIEIHFGEMTADEWDRRFEECDRLTGQEGAADESVSA